MLEVNSGWRLAVSKIARSSALLRAALPVHVVHVHFCLPVLSKPLTANR
jgi:hypothetical protein